MRLILPLIAFAVAALFAWALSRDGGALVLTRSATAQHDIELFCGVFSCCLQPDRFAHSDSVPASLSIEEQQIVNSVGMARFLRERIARFFGKPERA